jgi:hypothetical protein
MATVNKDFRVKHGLVVEGTNATVDGSDIITEEALTGGTQTNITVTYDPETKLVSFAAENGVADSDTDDLLEGETNLYYTNQRVKDVLTGSTQTNISITEVEGALTITAENGVEDSTTDDLDEGTTNKYFTDVRAVDAVETAATSTNTANKIVQRDENGSFAAEVVTVQDIKASDGTTIFQSDSFDEKKISVDRISVGFSSGQTRISEGLIEVYGSVKANILANWNGDPDVYLGNDSTADNLIASKGHVDSVVTDHSDLTTGVHGVTGDVVGTTDTQELTNKTLGEDVSLSADLDASENKIVNLANPTEAFDAATKAYVDATAEGLSVKPAVMAATTGNLASTYDNGTLGVGATLTSTSNGAFPLIDGVQLSTLNGQRGLLVKNQTDATQNGRYNLTTLGDENTPWVLTRCGLCDEVTEIPSAYVFVQGGDLYEATGWVAFVENPTNFVVGDDNISWFQFAGVGTYLAGNGLELDGNTFSIDEDVTATKDYVDETFVTIDSLPGQLDDYIPLTDKAANNGVATLDEEGQVPLDQLGNVTEAIDGLTTTDVAEGTNLYFTDTRAVDALEAVVPDFTAIEVNSIAKQVAATVSAPTAIETVAYVFAKATYRSAKFLVKVAYSNHTEVSEVLLTLDTADNIAITEFAIVSTNGSASTISAGIDGSNVELLVTPTNASSTITVVGTLLA